MKNYNSQFLRTNHPTVEYIDGKFIYNGITIQPTCINKSSKSVTIPADFIKSSDYLYFCGNVDEKENREFHFICTSDLADQRIFESHTTGADPYIYRGKIESLIAAGRTITDIRNLENHFNQPRLVQTSIF